MGTYVAIIWLLFQSLLQLFWPEDGKKAWWCTFPFSQLSIPSRRLTGFYIFQTYCISILLICNRKKKWPEEDKFLLCSP